MIEVNDETVQAYDEGMIFPREWLVKREIVGTIWMAKPFNSHAWIGPIPEWSAVVEMIDECKGLIDVIEATYVWHEDHWQKRTERWLDGRRWIDPMERLNVPDELRQFVPELKAMHEQLMNQKDLPAQCLQAHQGQGQQAQQKG